jgi:hypothetical protein
MNRMPLCLLWCAPAAADIPHLISLGDDLRALLVLSTEHKHHTGNKKDIKEKSLFTHDPSLDPQPGAMDQHGCFDPGHLHRVAAGGLAT